MNWFKEDQKELLQQAGLNAATDVTGAEGLAMKADLSIPWHKLRALRSMIHLKRQKLFRGNDLCSCFRLINNCVHETQTRFSRWGVSVVWRTARGRMTFFTGGH